jgi:hypothetical protein
MRVEGASAATRAYRMATTPLLPLVLMWRWGRFFCRTKYWRKFFCTLPLQFLLFGNWALGEFVGYFRGRGHSCESLFY